MTSSVASVSKVTLAPEQEAATIIAPASSKYFDILPPGPFVTTTSTADDSHTVTNTEPDAEPSTVYVQIISGTPVHDAEYYTGTIPSDDLSSVVRTMTDESYVYDVLAEETESTVWRSTTLTTTLPGPLPSATTTDVDADVNNFDPPAPTEAEKKRIERSATIWGLVIICTLRTIYKIMLSRARVNRRIALGEVESRDRLRAKHKIREQVAWYNKQRKELENESQPVRGETSVRLRKVTRRLEELRGANEAIPVPENIPTSRRSASLELSNVPARAGRPPSTGRKGSGDAPNHSGTSNQGLPVLDQTPRDVDVRSRKPSEGAGYKEPARNQDLHKAAGIQCMVEVEVDANAQLVWPGRPPEVYLGGRV